MGLEHAGKAVLLSLDVSRKGEVTVAQHESQVQYLGHALTCLLPRQVLFARDVIPREANEKIEVRWIQCPELPIYFAKHTCASRSCIPVM